MSEKEYTLVELFTTTLFYHADFITKPKRITLEDAKEILAGSYNCCIEEAREGIEIDPEEFVKIWNGLYDEFAETRRQDGNPID